MKAVCELDALNFRVAREVMEWELSTDGSTWCDVTTGECLRDVHCWNPAEEITDAWLVVEKFELYDIWKNRHEDTHRAEFYRKFGHWKEYAASAPTAPLAICLAALKAVEGD